MVDIVLAIIAILGLVAYFLPLVISVPAPALAAVLVLVILMAAFDFVLELRRSRRG